MQHFPIGPDHRAVARHAARRGRGPARGCGDRSRFCVRRWRQRGRQGRAEQPRPCARRRPRQDALHLGARQDLEEHLQRRLRQYWPPLVTKGRPQAIAGANSKLLGTSRRGDGRMQVTYAGHPLYYFVRTRRRARPTARA